MCVPHTNLCRNIWRRIFGENLDALFKMTKYLLFTQESGSSLLTHPTYFPYRFSSPKWGVKNGCLLANWRGTAK